MLLCPILIMYEADVRKYFSEYLAIFTLVRINRVERGRWEE